MIDTPAAAPHDTRATLPPGAAPGDVVDAAARERGPVPRAFADWPGAAPWQALPEAARRSFRLSALLLAGAISLGVAGLPLLVSFLDQEPGLLLGLLWGLPVVALIFGLALWRASVAYRNVRWRLDEDGLRVRRGRFWRSEILVPRARVQHLDIERGPIERRYGLATLIVHTAGMRMNALRQPGFDEDTAARLRDALVPKIREVDLPVIAAPQPAVSASEPASTSTSTSTSGSASASAAPASAPLTRGDVSEAHAAPAAWTAPDAPAALDQGAGRAASDR